MKGQWGKLVGYVLATAIVSAAVSLLLPLIGGGPGWLPDLISSEGSGIDKLFWGLIGLSIVIFAIVAGLVLYSIVHFRAAPGDLSDGEHIHGSAKMETAWRCATEFLRGLDILAPRRGLVGVPPW